MFKFQKVSSGVYRVLLQNAELSFVWKQVGIIAKQDSGPDKWTIEDNGRIILSSDRTLKGAKDEVKNINWGKENK